MNRIFSLIVVLFLCSNYLFSQRTVKIGAFSYYPAIFMDQQGKIQGFYVDAFKEIEEKENIQFKYVFGTWNEGLERIRNGEIDIMVSVAYTEERAGYLDYSSLPLLTVWGEVYVKHSSEIDGILSLEGKKIAIMKSDVNGVQLKILTEKLSINCFFLEKNDFDEVFQSVVANEVDAGVVNNTFGAGKSEQYNLRSTGIVFNPFDIYITVPKNANQDILNLFNEYLINWKHDINSVYNVSRQKWVHNKVDVIQFIPNWLKYVSVIIAVLSLLLTVFIILLRYRVSVATLKVKNSEAIFKTFMENSSAYVYIKDENLKHIYSNQKVKELEEHMRHNFENDASSIFDAETAKLLEDADRKILNFETTQLSIIYSVTIKNQMRWFHGYKFLLQLPNERPKVGGITLDITNLKEAEAELMQANKLIEQSKLDLQNKNIEYELINEELSQTNKQLILAKEKAEESDRLKSAFLQNISHEIRTPLNAISGFSGFLNNPDLTETRRKSFVSIIQKSSNQLVCIVSDILTIASLEAKQIDCNIHQVDINEIITDTYATHKNLALQKKLAILSSQSLSGKEALIYSDGPKIKYIFSSLLANAIKFTSEGYVDFGYTVKQNEIEFYVKDSGIGIKPDLHEIIFERFRQADDTIRIDYGGTGLGLAISKAFTELLGGKIWVLSDVGIGSTFYFKIPYHPVYDIDKPNSFVNQAKESFTVLVAEDEEFNYRLIEEILGSMDIKSLHAKNGQEAIDIFKTNSTIDLILMDIKMPVITGYDAAKIIKGINPDFPIWAQSAYAMEHEIEKYNDVFDDYLTKPIHDDLLISKLKKYLMKR